MGRRRSNNEDFLGDLLLHPEVHPHFGPEKTDERGYLFAVADGMGGYAGGEVASQLAITTLFQHYYNAPDPTNFNGNLLQAVSAANLAVHRAGQSRPSGFMGTTLTLVLFKGNLAMVCNVGDSRTYLLRQGQLSRVTRDHSIVQEQVDRGMLSPDQVEKSPIKNYITRAIGQHEQVETDYFEVALQPNDCFLLCSDGLHGSVEEAEIANLIAASGSLKTAAEQLVRLANKEGGPDNISVLLAQVLEVGEAVVARPANAVLSGKTNEITQPFGINGVVTSAVDASSAPASLLIPHDAPSQQFRMPASPALAPKEFIANPAPASLRTRKTPKTVWFAAAALLVALAVAAIVLVVLVAANSAESSDVSNLKLQPASGGSVAQMAAALPARSSQKTLVGHTDNIHRIRVVAVGSPDAKFSFNLAQPNNQNKVLEPRGSGTLENNQEFFYFVLDLDNTAPDGEYRVSGSTQFSFKISPDKIECNCTPNLREDSESQVLDLLIRV